MTKKGTFDQTIIFDDKGNKLTNAGIEKKELNDLVENCYFFGQFMAYYMVLKLVKLKGIEWTLKFVDKKFIEIGKGNPSFLAQAESIKENLSQYFLDSMEEKDTSLKDNE
jgi:hypothetical protein